MPAVEETVEVKIADHWNLKQADKTAKVSRPPITVGDMVTWFLDGNTAYPNAAIVDKVSEQNIHLTLLSPGSLGVQKQAVHHIDDPRLEQNRALKLNSGAWDYTAQQKKAQTQYRVLEEKVAALSKARDEQVQKLVDARIGPLIDKIAGLELAVEELATKPERKK